MVLGVAGRHVPVLIWNRAMLAAGPPARSPHRLRSPVLGAIGLGVWSCGVPLLAFALWRGSPPTISWAGWLLLAAVAGSAVSQIGALRSAAGGG
jgi:hypothetical protein